MRYKQCDLRMSYLTLKFILVALLITFCADLTPQLLRYFLTATDSEKEVEMSTIADSGILQEFSSEFQSRLSIVRQINFWKYHDIVQSMDIIANYGHLLTMKELILLNHAQLG